MTKINLEYFGMPGSGATVKEAKADAGRKIEAAMGGSYAPILLQHRGVLIVISRDPQYWGYRMFDLGEMGIRTVAGHCCCGFTSEYSVLLATVRHLADVTRTKGERDSVLFDCLRPSDQLRERSEFARKSAGDDEFQERYAEAVGLGMGEMDARDYAFRNPARRDLWQTAAA